MKVESANTKSGDTQDKMGIGGGRDEKESAGLAEWKYWKAHMKICQFIRQLKYTSYKNHLNGDIILPDNKAPNI